ncbi:MAG: YwqG family protein [Terracidiphilus sp.]
MKVFRVDTNADYQAFYLSNDDSDFWSDYLRDKCRLAPHWGQVSLKKDPEKCPQGNFAECWRGGGNFLMDAYAHSILMPILDQDIEILPIEPFRGVAYYFVNVLKVVDCLDRERTNLRGTGRVPFGNPIYQFFPEKLTDSTLFRAKGVSPLFTVVGRPGAEVEFKTVVEQAGLTGLKFEEVWSDGVPVTRRKGLVESVIFPAMPQATAVAVESGKVDSKFSNAKPFVAWAKEADEAEDWDEEQPAPSLGISDREEAVEAIRNSAFSAQPNTVATALRPSARLFICNKDGSERVGGARLTVSRFGGKPVLPENLAWPTWNKSAHIQEEIDGLERIYECARKKAGDSSEELKKNYQDKIAEMRKEMLAGETPLAFLGQLSLREIRAVAPLPGWPKEGILAFFYAPEQAWGGSPQDRGHCRILFFPEDAPLRRLDYPELLGEEGRYRERALTARCEWTLEKYLKSKSDGTQFWKKQEYLELLEKLNADGGNAVGPVHRCGGYAQEIQKKLRVQCQLVTNGLNYGDPGVLKDPRVPELDKGVMDWQLVMQFDSEMSLNWEWGSAGRVYFMARRQDIEAGDFSNCWAVLQCD